MSNTDNQEPKAKWLDRIKKMGWLAFAFFFLKGLVWLALFAGAGSMFSGC